MGALTVGAGVVTAGFVVGVVVVVWATTPVLSANGRRAPIQVSAGSKARVGAPLSALVAAPVNAAKTMPASAAPDTPKLSARKFRTTGRSAASCHSLDLL